LAVFVKDDGSLYTEHVALWVWIRKTDQAGEGYDEATGLLGRAYRMSVEASDDSDRFVGYCHEAEDVDVYRTSAEHTLKVLRRKREEMGRRR
jgi:hypothetical protein